MGQLFGPLHSNLSEGSNTWKLHSNRASQVSSFGNLCLPVGVVVQLKPSLKKYTSCKSLDPSLKVRDISPASTLGTCKGVEEIPS